MVTCHICRLTRHPVVPIPIYQEVPGGEVLSLAELEYRKRIASLMGASGSIISDRDCLVLPGPEVYRNDEAFLESNKSRQKLKTGRTLLMTRLFACGAGESSWHFASVLPFFSGF